IGLIPLVMITPADTALINEAGEERRKYLNSFISQLDKPYLTALVRYNQVLAERNKLLKNQYTVGFSDIIEVFNQQLSTHGATIYQARCRLVESLTPLVSRYYALLSEDREQVELTYKSELHDTPLETLLRESLQRDRVNLFTTCGIHRDDLKMKLGGYPLRKYGSQGQQKSFLTALKLAQYDLIAGQNPHQPLLLLDDIFDKLDTRRVEQLLAIITSDRFGQIFITDCNKVRLEHLLHACHTDYALFKTDAGSLQPLTPTP
ncbi:MAG: DNA replication and repair protein RecF, partial [Alistipes sp.]|nr:DNA replication and repair protein RecF [Alistipes sp.]